MMKVVLSLLSNHEKQTGGTKSLTRMRKQAAWNTRVLEEILFSAFGAKNKTGERQKEIPTSKYVCPAIRAINLDNCAGKTQNKCT